MKTTEYPSTQQPGVGTSFIKFKELAKGLDSVETIFPRRFSIEPKRSDVERSKISGLRKQSSMKNKHSGKKKERSNVSSFQSGIIVPDKDISRSLSTKSHNDSKRSKAKGNQNSSSNAGDNKDVVVTKQVYDYLKGAENMMVIFDPAKMKHRSKPKNPVSESYKKSHKSFFVSKFQNPDFAVGDFSPRKLSSEKGARSSNNNFASSKDKTMETKSPRNSLPPQFINTLPVLGPNLNDSKIKVKPNKPLQAKSSNNKKPENMRNSSLKDSLISNNSFKKTNLEHDLHMPSLNSKNTPSPSKISDKNNGTKVSGTPAASKPKFLEKLPKLAFFSKDKKQKTSPDGFDNNDSVRISKDFSETQESLSNSMPKTYSSSEEHCDEGKGSLYANDTVDKEYMQLIQKYQDSGKTKNLSKDLASLSDNYPDYDEYSFESGSLPSISLFGPSTKSKAYDSSKVITKLNSLDGSCDSFLDIGTKDWRYYETRSGQACKVSRRSISFSDSPFPPKNQSFAEDTDSLRSDSINTFKIIEKVKFVPQKNIHGLIKVNKLKKVPQAQGKDVHFDTIEVQPINRTVQNGRSIYRNSFFYEEGSTYNYIPTSSSLYLTDEQKSAMNSWEVPSNSSSEAEAFEYGFESYNGYDSIIETDFPQNKLSLQMPNLHNSKNIKKGGFKSHSVPGVISRNPFRPLSISQLNKLSLGHKNKINRLSDSYINYYANNGDINSSSTKDLFVQKNRQKLIQGNDGLNKSFEESKNDTFSEFGLQKHFVQNNLHIEGLRHSRSVLNKIESRKINSIKDANEIEWAYNLVLSENRIDSIDPPLRGDNNSQKAGKPYSIRNSIIRNDSILNRNRNRNNSRSSFASLQSETSKFLLNPNNNVKVDKSNKALLDLASPSLTGDSEIIANGPRIPNERVLNKAQRVSFVDSLISYVELKSSNPGLGSKVFDEFDQGLLNNSEIEKSSNSISLQSSVEKPEPLALQSEHYNRLEGKTGIKNTAEKRDSLLRVRGSLETGSVLLDNATYYADTNRHRSEKSQIKANQPGSSEDKNNEFGKHLQILGSDKDSIIVRNSLASNSLLEPQHNTENDYYEQDDFRDRVEGFFSTEEVLLSNFGPEMLKHNVRLLLALYAKNIYDRSLETKLKHFQRNKACSFSNSTNFYNFYDGINSSKDNVNAKSMIGGPNPSKGLCHKMQQGGDMDGSPESEDNSEYETSLFKYGSTEENTSKCSNYHTEFGHSNIENLELYADEELFQISFMLAKNLLVDKIETFCVFESNENYLKILNDFVICDAYQFYLSSGEMDMNSETDEPTSLFNTRTGVTNANSSGIADTLSSNIGNISGAPSYLKKNSANVYGVHSQSNSTNSDLTNLDSDQLKFSELDINEKPIGLKTEQNDYPTSILKRNASYGRKPNNNKTKSGPRSISNKVKFSDTGLVTVSIYDRYSSYESDSSEPSSYSEYYSSDEDVVYSD
ncbi:hypothetical protein BB560_004549 [Smittium megazygosporum]|uniref:Uncharacterized protein n=1 Tax=Smittium megazygosporum TaxID=133381 RepID=A0A2T9Z943_9FUNG|nr:hypothetical protein BB560_004549 [Smittium megazygosporum]